MWRELAWRVDHACVLTMLLVSFAAGPVAAQTAIADEAQLIERLDSLTIAFQRADSVADIADRINRRASRPELSTPSDTLRIGPFQVVTPEGQAQMARRYFERAWAPYEAVVGPGPTSLQGHLFTFQSRKPYVHLDVEGSTEVLARSNWESLENTIGRKIGEVLALSLPEDLRSWTGSFFLLESDREELEWTYRRLVTTRSTAAGDCYDGVLTRCWDAVGLDHQERWWAEWYDAADRAALVERGGSGVSRIPENEVVRSICVEDHSDAACVEYLSLGTAAIPLTSTERMALATHALRLGGAGAFQRMAANPERPIKDRLTDAAGVSADSLIYSWQAAVLASRPEVREGTTRSHWTSFLWLMVLGALSMRSTRWRLT